MTLRATLGRVLFYGDRLLAVWVGNRCVYLR